MSNRTLIELNHDYCPTDENLMAWAKAMQTYMRQLNPERNLPDGVRYVQMRHHSDPTLSGEELARRLR
jgi:hypothetical protein